MKYLKKKVFQVTLVYNFEEDTAVKALDKAISAHPITPISVSCEPMEMDDDDD